MSRIEREPPRRWTDGAAGDAATRRAADLLRVPPPAPLGAAARARVGMRLAAGRTGPAAGAGALGRYALTLTGVAVLAAATVAAVGAFRGSAVKVEQPAPAPPAPVPAVDPATTSEPTSPRDLAPLADAVAPGRPAPLVSAPRPAVLTPARAQRLRPTSPGAAKRLALRPAALPLPAGAGAASAAIEAAPTPAPAALAPERDALQPGAARGETAVVSTPAALAPLSEPRLVATALAHLRAGEDPQGALSLLAEHRRRFPDGALAPEARLAEVEALLALGRRREALRQLDRLTPARMPRGDALSVVRAELRAGAGRCADAISDFGRCTDQGRCAADVEARALYGRALCHERLGQHEEAFVHLRRYLARFPRGPAAETARRALDGARGGP